jgi:hypothetical protein
MVLFTFYRHIRLYRHTPEMSRMKRRVNARIQTQNSI